MNLIFYKNLNTKKNHDNSILLHEFVNDGKSQQQTN